MEDLKLPEDFYHEGTYDYYNSTIEEHNKDDDDEDDKEEESYRSNNKLRRPVNNQTIDRSSIVQEALKLLDLIEDTSDNLKKIYYFDKLNKLNEDTVVFRSIVEYTRKKLINSLNEDSELEYPLGLNINTFLTPKEIIDKELIKDKSDLDWFNDLDFRSKGFATPNNITNQKTIGWNDVLDFNPDNISKAALRANKQFANDVLVGINFIDLSNTPYEEKKSNKFFRGITTYIIHGEPKFSYVPNIYISVGNGSKQVFSIRDGHIGVDRDESLTDIKKNYKWAFIEAFFIPLSKEDYDKFIKNLMNKDILWYINNNNFITKMKKVYPNQELKIINDKLFIINLLSIYTTILNAKSTTSNEELERMLNSNILPNPIYIYILFKGNKNEFDNEFIFNKLESMLNLNIDPNLDPFLEGYCSLKEFNSVLNENSEIDNHNDCLDRIDYEELYG